jgi:preprotein translocase subunit SecG
MYGFLLSLMVLDGLLLCVVILLQSGKGGGLAAMGGSGTATDGIMAGRQASAVLVRSTWIMSGIFLFLAFVLSIMSSRASQPQSILRDTAPATAPAPLLPGDAGDPAGATGGATDPATVPPGGDAGTGETGNTGGDGSGSDAN